MSEKWAADQRATPLHWLAHTLLAGLIDVYENADTKRHGTLGPSPFNLPSDDQCRVIYNVCDLQHHSP